MAITIDHIATKAGVSSTTVSRVINNSGYVKSSTREKVLSVIKEMNYVPSAIARSLSKNETNIIGIIVPDVTNSYFGEIIKGISKKAEENGLSIILFNANNNMNKEIKALKQARELRLKGVIMTSSFGEYDNQEYYKEIINNFNFPIVLVSADLKAINLNGVFVDDLKGGYEATKLLINEGHSKIAIVTGLLTSEPAKDRLEGYKKALIESNISINYEYILHGEFNLQKSYDETIKLLALKNKPTAIVACSNKMTFGVIKALTERKLTVPRDMALVGFNKLQELELLGLKLTYVEDSPERLGEKALKILLKKLNEGEIDKVTRVKISPELIILGSEKLDKPS